MLFETKALLTLIDYTMLAIYPCELIESIFNYCLELLHFEKNARNNIFLVISLAVSSGLVMFISSSRDNTLGTLEVTFLGFDFFQSILYVILFKLKKFNISLLFYMSVESKYL